jgi:hypothetical protein
MALVGRCCAAMMFGLRGNAALPEIIFDTDFTNWRQFNSS